MLTCQLLLAASSLDVGLPADLGTVAVTVGKTAERLDLECACVLVQDVCTCMISSYHVSASGFIHLKVTSISGYSF